MRNLIIRINEEARNYFYYEAEQFLKERMNRKAIIEVEFVSRGFNHKEEVELRSDFDLKSYILKVVNNKIDKEILNDVFYKEKELFQDGGQAFEMFVKRYDEKLCQYNQKPFPFFISLQQLYDFYELGVAHYGHLFFSKMERIINVLQELFTFILSLKKEESIEQLANFFYGFIKNDSNFEKMKMYVTSCLSSLSLSRIEELYPKSMAYQQLQIILFRELPRYFGFDFSYRYHQKITELFVLRFHLALFEGHQFKENDDFNRLIFVPVIQEMYGHIQRGVHTNVENYGYEEDELNEILNIYKC